MQLSRFSIGTGDRFGLEGEAQIAAFRELRAHGGEADIVWNKSNREHLIIGSSPADQAARAAAAIQRTGWDGPWFVDADHISLKTVDWFLPHCNFFTIDVAETIGKKASAAARAAYLEHARFLLDEGAASVAVSQADIETVADKFLAAVQEAGITYRYIAAKNQRTLLSSNFRWMRPMSLRLLRRSPRFSSRWRQRKYRLLRLRRAFRGNFSRASTMWAMSRHFWAPSRQRRRSCCGLSTGWAARGFKLSVHTGSDKFRLYRGIHEIVARLGAGVHLKTAGTTWLEEIVGLAEAGGDGLALAKRVYEAAYARIDELVAPYANVVEIDKARLPRPEEVAAWDSATFVQALRHEPGSSTMQPDMRQLMHVGFKVAAEMDKEFSDTVLQHRGSVARNVQHNLYERHLLPLILG